MYDQRILIDLTQNSFKIIIGVTKRKDFGKKLKKYCKNKEILLVIKIKELVLKHK